MFTLKHFFFFALTWRLVFCSLIFFGETNGFSLMVFTQTWWWTDACCRTNWSDCWEWRSHQLCCKISPYFSLVWIKSFCTHLIKMGYNCSFFFFTSRLTSLALLNMTLKLAAKSHQLAHSSVLTSSRMLKPFLRWFLSATTIYLLLQTSMSLKLQTTAKAKMTPLLQSTLHQRESNSSNRRRSKRLYSHFHDYNKFCFFTIPDPELLPILYYNRKLWVPHVPRLEQRGMLTLLGMQLKSWTTRENFKPPMLML